MKRESEKKVKEIEEKMETGFISEEESKERENALSVLWELDRQEHANNKLRYKNKWCLEGDENSKLFHRNLNRKKKEKQESKGS